MDQVDWSISATRDTAQVHAAGRTRSHLSNSLNQLKINSKVSLNIGLAHKLHTYGAPAQPAPAQMSDPKIVLEEWTMWTKPDFTEMRFGFEITMYIGNR